MLGEQLRKSIPEVILPFKFLNSKGTYTKVAYTLDYELGEYRQSALVRLLCNSVVNFALTPDEVNKLSAQKDYGVMNTLAWSRISEAKKEKKGDYGEILLYLITEYYSSAPKLITKVFLKTSVKEQIKGYDCAHFSIINDSITLFLGEAKLHKSFSGGLDSAIESINDHCTREFLTNEFSLLLPHVKVNEDVDASIYEKVIPILNRSVSLDRVDICVPILLAFDAPEIQQGTSLEDKEHIERLTRLFQSKFAAIERRRITIAPLKKITFKFILLPFKSIDEFREMLDNIEGAIKQCKD